MSNKFTVVTFDMRTLNKEQSIKLTDLLTEFINNGVSLTIDNNGEDSATLENVQVKHLSLVKLSEKIVKEAEGMPMPAAQVLAKTYQRFRELKTTYHFPDENAVELAKAMIVGRDSATKTAKANDILVKAVKDVVIPNIPATAQRDVMRVVEQNLLKR